MTKNTYLSFSALPFYLMHIIAFCAFFFAFSWKMLLLIIISYYARMIFITVGYHRYFSHRSFKTSRSGQFLLAFLAQTSAQKGALWWAANHRHHHKFSDEAEDLHSPRQKGFWHSHVGWILADDHQHTEWKYISDFSKYPELVFLNKYYLLPPTLYALLLFFLFGAAGLMWGFFFSTMLLFHGTFFINSLAHVMGKRVYPSSDDSKNSFILALLTCGEGWHNNHHHFQASARQGWKWWQIDLSFYVLKILSLLKLVKDLREVPERVKEKTLKKITEEKNKIIKIAN